MPRVPSGLSGVLYLSVLLLPSAYHFSICVKTKKLKKSVSKNIRAFSTHITSLPSGISEEEKQEGKQQPKSENYDVISQLQGIFPPYHVTSVTGEDTISCRRKEQHTNRRIHSYKLCFWKTYKLVFRNVIG